MMTKKQFAQMISNNLCLLERAYGNDVAAKKDPERPCAPWHLSWMLWEACEFYSEDFCEKAHRWLGYVQGVLSSQGMATLDELKSSITDGDEFKLNSSRPVGWYWVSWVSPLTKKNMPPEITYWNGRGWVASGSSDDLSELTCEVISGPIQA